MKGIYKITNILNDKVYIGYSSDIDTRWTEHKSGSSNIQLRKDIRALGTNNFKFEIIEEVSDISDIETKETYWIKKYQANNVELYNLSKTTDASNYKRQTYYMSQNIIDALSLYAFVNKKDKSSVVREAIKRYIEDKYFKEEINRRQ